MLAQEAIAEDLTGEARAHLDAAQAMRKSRQSMQLMATLEDKAGNRNAAEICRNTAASAAPDRVWVCRETGRVYAAWMPFAPPHNAFNTIVWDEPATAKRETPALSAQPDATDALQLIDYVAA